jgi:hypothetical protein
MENRLEKGLSHLNPSCCLDYKVHQRLKPLLVMRSPPARTEKFSPRGGLRIMSKDFQSLASPEQIDLYERSLLAADVDLEKVAVVRS